MLQQKPRFAAEYSEARRAGSHDEAVYTSDYGINPYHDINGVGLVYFAAYPTIVDTCELEQIGEGPAWASRASTVLRDVMYFSNADANDTLVYSLLEQVKKGNIIESRAMISNKESGLIMALVRTSKALCVG
jgi:probable biosynthetic protein (TIGR04098 family)